MKKYNLNIIPEEIKLLNTLFNNNNGKLYLVGGCVRDFLLNLKIKDFDVCTDLLPDTIIKILSDNNIKYRLEGKHFGIVVAVFDTNEFEIATFREDLNNTKNRFTDVKIGVTMQEDALRRDFTINSLYVNITTGEIIDLVGGINDLNSKLLVTNGDPAKRFCEDGLRILRAIRFASKLNLKIDDKIKQAFKNPACLRSLKQISRPRIVNEFINTFNTANNKHLLMYHYKHNPEITKIIFKFCILKGFVYSNVLEFDYTYNIETFISEIITESSFPNKELFIQLKDIGFDSKLSSGVDLIINIKNTLIKNLNILEINRNIKKSNLSFNDLNLIFDTSVFENISNIISNTTKELVSQGFTGQQLGELIYEKSNKTFQNLIK